ncbi:PxKF domain-containing protein [Phycicoccus sp. SLBN-51]|uniref:OmpL47-type beta-barrel domain-containing protein n=1 Tax=Phycicoccus sp. SLBN-51 TaxID=2768447 RepID=UPI00114E818B|nr:PxKF domain-containing protein [Phycicoccus sp. SLBN-51]
MHSRTPAVTASRPDGSTAARRRRRQSIIGGTAVAAVVGAALTAAPAWASSVTSATFSGGAGTVTVGGVVYAKQGGALTLTVVTSTDTKCVDVTGAATLPRQTSSTARSTWTFTTTAPAGNGAQAFTVAASPNFNANGCTGQTNSTQASYTLDNTGPAVSAELTPAANPAGWNSSDVTVKWTATDAGVGVSGTQPFRTDSLSANGITNLTTPAQSDRLGNTGPTGATTVRIDKAKPTITASQTKNPDGTTTVTFTCDDSNSGGGQASGVATCLADGSTTNSKTVQPGVTVTGTATDKAGNTATASSTAPAGDTSAPLLSGTATTAPNGSGWYRDDVTIRWTASDPESGVPNPPADTTISGEGTGLTSTTTVRNGAGLSTTATSSPAVNIDRTAPVTAISGTSNAWFNGNVTLKLAATDNLSKVARTQFTVDGGVAQEGNSISLTTEGDHTVTFFSVDNAGNAEAAQSAHVKIDKTAPTISHGFTPVSYRDSAWTNQDVTVTFTCADQGGSGVASCTGPVAKTAEGTFDVTGTATDGAGNSATDVAHVLIDKTAPKITATAVGSKSSYGWYGDDVVVTYTASDALSGLTGAPANKVLGEGANQSASEMVSDAAGNTASAGVTGIDVDKTPPVLSADFSTGWHTGDVKVSWTCTDPLSGVAAGPPDDTVTGEGANLSSTASCTDKAGNTTTKTVAGIQIDRTAPTTLAALTDPLPSGWYGGPVQVSLTGSDNGSGVASTYYTVDDGTQQAYDGAFAFGTEGTHTIAFWSTDRAGNVEKSSAPLTLRIDKTAPTTTVINPISPDSGWFVTSGIPVAFEAADAGSGVKATYYTIDGGARQTYGEPFTADLSTGTHTITYWSVDLADNEEAHEATNTIAVKVDTVPPTITGQRAPGPNSADWNNTDVKVTFSCSDADSGVDGIAGCGPDQTVSSEGSDQSVRGDTQDVAGNASSVTVDKINIDKTAPSLTGAPTGDSNGGEWYRGDVSIAWTGADGLSGIDAATQPVNSTIKGEGRNLGASASISDRAGNKGAGTVTGINIDRTPLDITAQLPTGKNAAGWYRSAVSVGFSCADPALGDGSAGSGVGTCPSDAVVSGDGAGQSVTSDTAKDVAGNTSTRTVTGINIDGHEPQTTADNQCTATNGYCTGDTATVVLNASDIGPSGVKEIRYSVNGATELVTSGASTSVSVPLSGTGSATLKYYAVDVAGNVEPTNQVALKYDNIAPTVTHTVNPKANAADWNNSDVTVHFDAKDTDPGSGVAAGSVTPDQVVSPETNATGIVVNGSAKDTAGNTGTDSVTVKLDKTKPTIGGSVVTGTLGKNGWYVSPVKVHFTCSDALSGLASCQDDVTLSNNGANQSANGSAKDVADNVGTTSATGINIDNENPTITKVNVANGFYTLGDVPAASCDATDSFSGLDTCKVTVTAGTANGVGTFSWTASATDKAGNTVSQSGTYKVVYRFDGFLQPINDTAHQIGTSTSVFKAGSTVPVKFQVKKADGTVVQAAAAPTWLTPVKGGSMSLPVDESTQTVTADSGSTFRYDTTDRQYIYNWKTGTGGNYWQIGVRLDDGQTYYVNIALR